MKYALRFAVVAAVLAVVFAFTLERGRLLTVQRGYRGLGEVQVYNQRRLESPETQALNAVPDPEDKVDLAGTPSSQVYQNVQVLGDLDSNELVRLMNAITKWVAPEQGCAYCHGEGGNFAEDALYTKVVARRMLQMTQNINTHWKNHVSTTGVTCYTCHRGNPVPQNIWFTNPNEPEGMVGNRAGKNAPAPQVGLASLPNDPFTPFLLKDENIRVVSTTALPENNRSSIKQAEWTYGLMMHMSQSLGVNCTYCHNSRSFSAWDQSSVQRATAWYGIRLVRDVNTEYLTPLTAKFPASRLGPHGDIGKVNCTTCHQGAYKPLFGASMLGDYQELAGPIQKAALHQVDVKPQAEKAKVDNAVVFKISGQDVQGREATFDFMVLDKNYSWALGSASQIMAGAEQVPEQQTTARLVTPAVRQALDQSSDIIAVGLASAEGEAKAEEERAQQRAQSVAGWLSGLEIKSATLWRLSLGQYNKACQSTEDADTSFQRPVIFAGVRSKDENVDLQEALANAISGKSNLPSRECYSKFDLAKVE